MTENGHAYALAQMVKYWCRYCDAAPGEPCRTRAGGQVTSGPHSDRLNQWREDLRRERGQQ